MILLRRSLGGELETGGIQVTLFPSSFYFIEAENVLAREEAENFEVDQGFEGTLGRKRLRCCRREASCVMRPRSGVRTKQAEGPLQ